MDIAWEAPPGDPRQVASAKWAEVAAALREQPGEWALIREEASASLVGHINSGALRSFSPAGSFQARSKLVRTDDAGRRIFKVWARAMPSG